MKKVAIVTLYGNDNYGNKLQNYALQLTIEKLNFEVLTLKNINNCKNNFEFLITKSLFNIKYIIKSLIPKYRYTCLRYNAFIKFNKQYLKYSNKNVYIMNKPTNFYKNCYYCIGSDQVWNPYASSNLTFFLGKYFPYDLTFSYAASFGVNQFSEDQTKLYSEYLPKIKNISVRETMAKKIVNQITDRNDVDVLIDPTLLLEKTEWVKIEKCVNKAKNQKYILNYFLGNLSDERRMVIEKIAKENNCIIINLLDRNSEYYATGPSEFLYLEENAFLICTDSFHSCVFAFIFDRPFMVFDREDSNENMSSRIENLLEKFELSDRHYNDNAKEINVDHDYSKGYKILEIERKKTSKFLKRVLNVEDSD